MIHIDRIINSTFESNTFVISSDGSKGIWLVDVGDINKVFDILPNDAIVRGVFLTHTHFDHIYGINLLFNRYPEMVVYVAESGKEALFSSKKNLSLYHESPLEYKGSNIKTLKEGDIIELYPDVDIKVISTPGHSPDSLSYLLLEKYLFTGDAYIPNVPVVSKLPGGNKIIAAESKRQLIELSHGRVLFPGHGDIIGSII